jgi:hypothetical protein
MYAQLEQIALSEFGDVVIRTQIMGRRAGVALKLRLHIRDGTIVDVWLSPNHARYAYHWEQRAKRGLLHRHDNAPDHPHVSTFPKHFHNGGEEAVEESHISNEPPTALREFLSFVRDKLAEYEV